jgi:hypothetical protein
MEVGDGVNVNGTSRRGTVKTTYDELVAVFGEPTYMGGDKTTAEWNIEFVINEEHWDGEEYVVATIYDWKMDSTPYGPHDWHVGGNAIDALWAVQDKLDEYQKSWDFEKGTVDNPIK